MRVNKDRKNTICEVRRMLVESNKIEAVNYRGGHSTRKPSTVTMAVTHKFALVVAELLEDYLKKGETPEEGLIRLELLARYAEDECPDNDVSAVAKNKLEI